MKIKWFLGISIVAGVIILSGLNAYAQEAPTSQFDQSILNERDAQNLQRGLYALEGMVLQMEQRLKQGSFSQEEKRLIAGNLGGIQVSLAFVTTHMTVLAATMDGNEDVAKRTDQKIIATQDANGEPSQENIQALGLKNNSLMEASVQSSVDPKKFTWPIVIIAGLMLLAIIGMIIKNRITERSVEQKVETKQQASIPQSQPSQPIQQPPQSNNTQQ